MLDKVVAGSTANIQSLTWARSDGSVQDLTGYTITGRLYSLERRVGRAITGTLAILVAASGTFTWDRSDADVGTPGIYEVQFIATGGGKAEISYSELWQVEIAR